MNILGRRRRMIIVDTHCHALPHWFEPVEMLLHQMNANGVDKATLVEVRGQFDNRYLMECVQRFPGRFSPVVIVDTDTPEAPETLARWASEGAEGVRPSPTTSSPGSDPLAIWRKAATWDSRSVASARRRASPRLTSSRW
jgi:L-fuconolactonase